MTKVIGVRFKSSGRIYYFDPGEFDVNVGDGVIVETARGQEFADVLQGVTEVEDTMIVSPLKPVLRMATSEDRNMRETNTGKEDEAFAICANKIQQHGLDMKLVDVEYSYNGSKVIFYFTADERVDFRELVKDLAAQFKTRIELRQIGVRDEAKMIGGLGSCGRPVCCKSFLDDFRPVSIKMAKEQNLSLSPTKISGLCGRLMCCLQYEQAGYEDMKKKMPKVNKEIITPDGPGVVVENNAITEKTRVRLILQDGSVDIREYHYSLLAKPGDPLPEQPAKEAAAPQTPPATQDGPQPATAGAEGEAPEQTQRTRHRRRSGQNRVNRPALQNDEASGPNAQPTQPNVPAREQQAAGEQRPQPRQNRRPPKAPSVPGGETSPGEGGQSVQRSDANRRRRRRPNRPRPEASPKPAE